MSEPENQLSLLKVHEWLAITVIIGVIAGLTCLTSLQNNGTNRTKDSTRVTTTPAGFDVLIQGAVDYPGIYHVESPMKLQELLALAGVRNDADLRRFRLDHLVKKGRTIRVPARQMIQVHLKGAVANEQTLNVPKGTKMEELLSLANFVENADRQVLKKKRRLKADEVIIIPLLTMELKEQGHDHASE